MNATRKSEIWRTIPLLIAARHCERSAAIKTRVFVAMAVFLLTLVAIPAQAKYGGGSGTADDPYQIWTAEQMNAIGPEPNDWDNSFKLMADIDLSAYTGTAFNIIGTPDRPFTGVFDGNAKKISSFARTSAGTKYIGLFGHVSGKMP